MRDKYTFREISLCKDPFLTILTRHVRDSRILLFDKCMKSIYAMTSNDFQHVLIQAPRAYGFEEANRSFGYVTEMIKGKYVLLLDDDDIILNRNLLVDVRREASMHGSPDVILFKCLINEKIYPLRTVWEKTPRVGHIGGSCFVTRTDIFIENIHTFTKPRCGDFSFIQTLFDKQCTRRWLDKVMIKTLQVGRGIIN